MDIKQALDKCSETMELAAQHFKDKGSKIYTADLHCSAAGMAVKQAIAAGLEPTAKNIAALFLALHNQSAWRQKWERKGFFPKREERSLDSTLTDLEAEFGEE